MADTAPKATEAPKTTAKAAEPKLTDSPQWSENENGDIVFHAEYPDQARIDKDRERISNELKDSDKYDSDGLASNVTGDASEKDADHFFSPDPAKRAFPPGPDSPADL